MSNGKGSKRRPQKVTTEEFGNNWDSIFKKRVKADGVPTTETKKPHQK